MATHDLHHDTANEDPPTVEGSKNRAEGRKPAVLHVPKSTHQDADFTLAERPDRDLEGAVGWPEPVVRNLKKVGILSLPHQDGVDNVAIAPSVSLAANQTPASLITQAAGPPSEEGSPVGAVAQGLQSTARPAAHRPEGAVGRLGRSVQGGRNDQGHGRAREHEQGPIAYDGGGPVVNLRRAREMREAHQWNIICLSCWELRSEVFVHPCRHNFLCQRCFFDPYFSGLSSCPVCTRPTDGLVLSKDMLDLLIRRSMR